ncbi:hypothetical protein JL721_11783 [Aureococcus anophagefferens]|nr:hypothetical protein JL721_11783 [Aureococcus anophagefferens]
MADHGIGGDVLYPGVGYVELAFQLLGVRDVSDLRFLRPCTLPCAAMRLVETGGGFEAETPARSSVGHRLRVAPSVAGVDADFCVLATSTLTPAEMRTNSRLGSAFELRRFASRRCRRRAAKARRPPADDGPFVLSWMQPPILEDGETLDVVVVKRQRPTARFLGLPSTARRVAIFLDSACDVLVNGAKISIAPGAWQYRAHLVAIAARLSPSRLRHAPARPHVDAAALRELATRGLVTNSTIPTARIDPGRQTKAKPGFYGAFAVVGAFSHSGAAFGISHMEAKGMDAKCEIILEKCRGAPRRGLPRPSRTRSWASTSAAAASNDLSGDGLHKAPPSVYEGTSNALSVASGRASYVLGMTGPCWTVDTACSSSLVALHSAAGGLRNDECPKAAVSGASLNVASLTSAFAARDAQRPRRCHTFDRRGDGYCRGEGAATFVVSCDGGDATVEGSAVQQDGPSASLTAPNGSSQKRLLAAVAALSSEAMVAVEAHGTGTALGDPIEVGAAAGALCAGAGVALVAEIERGPPRARRRLAGLATLLVTRLRAQATPPNAQLRGLNAHLMTQAARGMPEAILARGSCGVSSFGFSGTIVHAGLAKVPGAATPAPVEAGSTSLFRIRCDRARSCTALTLVPAAAARGARRLRRRAPAAAKAVLADHAVGGDVLYPGVGYVEMAFQFSGGESRTCASCGLRAALRGDALRRAAAAEISSAATSGGALATHATAASRRRRAPPVASARRVVPISSGSSTPTGALLGRARRPASSSEIGGDGSQLTVAGATVAVAPGAWRFRAVLVANAARLLAAAAHAADTVVDFEAPRVRQRRTRSRGAASAAANLGAVAEAIGALLVDLIGTAAAADGRSCPQGSTPWAGRVRAALGAKFGMDLPSTALFDHPTSGALAAYVAGAGAADDAVEEAAVAARVAARRPSPAPVRAAPPARRARAPGDAAAVAAAIGVLLVDLTGTAAAADTPLMSAGLDSVGRAKFAQALGAKFGVELESAALFDHPTSGALVEYLCGQMGGGGDAVGEARDAAPAPSAAVGRPVACVAAAPRRVTLAPSMAFVLAGPVARARAAFAFQGAFPGHGNAFAISVMEARVMDPQHSLVLEGASRRARTGARR